MPLPKKNHVEMPDRVNVIPYESQFGLSFERAHVEPLHELHIAWAMNWSSVLQLTGIGVQ